MSAANSLAAKVAAVSPPSLTPASFNNDQSLYMLNLFLMTAGFFLGVMMVGKQVNRIWSQRLFDHPLDPVTLYRLILTCAAAALTLRCGAEALYLWNWNSHEPATVARAVMAKRWIDPIAFGFALIWMTVSTLGEPGIEHQLRKAPLPVDMWSRWPALARALGVIIFSFIAAAAAVLLR